MKNLQEQQQQQQQRRRHRFRRLLVLLGLQLVWVSLFIQLCPASAFIQYHRAIRHRRRIRSERGGGRIGSSSSIDSSKGGNSDGEFQDAYGRTLHNRGYHSNEDPLLSAAERSAATTNLEPLVICGPSGVGKGTLIEALRKRFPIDAFGFGVSHTTRSPRPGEIHGQDYFFSTQHDMQRNIADCLFVEHRLVHGNYYGTSQETIASLQGESRIPILDMDVRGVASVKESGISAKYVFVSPPSLEARLRGRGTETEEAIQTHLGNAASEMEYGTHQETFDHVLVNYEIEQAVDQLVEVLLGWYPQFATATVAYKNPPSSRKDTGGNQQPSSESYMQPHSQQQSVAKAYQREPWDFLAQSDRMTRFPSVRTGHGRFVAGDRSESEFRAKHYGAYTVDLEEPEGPRGCPKLGMTNINIPLEEQERSRNLQQKQQQQQQQQQRKQEQHFNSYLVVDNEVPDGARGHLKLETTYLIEFLKEAEGRPYQRYYRNGDSGGYSSQPGQGGSPPTTQLPHQQEPRQRYRPTPSHKIGRGEFGKMFRPEVPKPVAPDSNNHHGSDSPQSYPRLGRTKPFV